MDQLRATGGSRRRSSTAPALARTKGRVAAAVALLLVLTGCIVQTRFGTTPAAPDPAAAGLTPEESAELQSTAGYLKWSDAATWEGKPPAAGADVTIPEGKKVLLDVTPPALGTLDVQGTLVFDDSDLELRARAVLVRGALRVGSPLKTFGKRARIVLTGGSSNANVGGVGTKVLGVIGGTLDLHGEQRPSWTRLNAAANPGDKRLILDKAMPWRKGDRIVVASTDFDSGQAEKFTITAVSGATVALDRPLRHQHWGTLQKIAGKTLDERAEVALLTRNVTVEGDAATSGTGFGGHMMIMGTARLRGVEITRMGQQGRLARYPVHFHMHGDGSKSYVRDSSIHDTFNRCITIHGTDKLTVAGNVCSDHIGHGYFLEDGAETGNVLENNLGLLTRKPPKNVNGGKGVLPSDEKAPATFWITNPANTFRGNVAAGSEGHGFWFALPEHPNGPSKTTKVWPQRTPLGEFSGNVAHSNDKTGLMVDDGPKADGTTDNANYRPVSTPSNEKSKPVPARFVKFAAYKNRERGVWTRGKYHRLEQAVLADNAIGATFASEQAYLVDSFVVGESANKGRGKHYEKKGADGRALPRPYKPEFPIRGFEFYDGLVGAENTTFANFRPNAQRPASALGFLIDNAFPLNPSNYAKKLRFVDANEVYIGKPEQNKVGDNSAVFRDSDGSVTGTAGRNVTVDVPFLHNGTCSRRAEWNAFVCDTATASVSVKSSDAGKLQPLTLRRGDGAEQSVAPAKGRDYVASTVLRNSRYEVGFLGGQAPGRAEYVLRGKGTHVELVIPTTSAPKVTRYGCDISNPKEWCYGGKPGSLDELARSKKSSSFYDAGAGLLYLRLVGEKDYEALEVSA